MRRTNKQIIKYVVLGLIYAILYMTIEVLYDGDTHYSMGILAFLVGLLIGGLNEVTSRNTSLLVQGFYGACIATAGEYLFGIIFNKDYAIWSYLDQPFNFQGQICLLFFFIWFVLSLIVILLDDFLRFWIFNEERPKYKLF